MSTASRPSARIVIVNWRGADLTVKAARSIEPQLAPGDRLVIVDNHSGDDSVERLREAGLEVIETPQNLGFGGGVNAGAAGMEEDVLVLLNNDATAEPGFLEALTTPLGDPSSHIGATTALMILAGRWRHARKGVPALVGVDGTRWERVGAEEPGGEVLINSTGNLVDASGNGYDRDWLTPLADLNSPEEVFGICGGACAIRADVWRKLGGFREDLFMYYEDTDLSWRLHEAGYEVRFARGARVFHEHAASSGTDSPMFIRVNARNRLIVATAHAPAAVAARAWARSLARLLRGPQRSLLAGALTEAARTLPAELRRRRSRSRTHRA